MSGAVGTADVVMVPALVAGFDSAGVRMMKVPARIKMINMVNVPFRMYRR